ncbi:MAG: sulfatase [Acidobacteriota bacterium]
MLTDSRVPRPTKPLLRLSPLSGRALGLLAGVCLVVFGCSGTPNTGDTVGRDLVLVTIDTVRADHLPLPPGAPAVTPTFTRLAEEGTVFTAATTPLPRTTPALVSLLTGLQPHRHGSREVLDRPERDVVDGLWLAQRLAADGYRTIGVSASAAADSAMGLDAGFESFVDARELPATTAEHVTDAALAHLPDEATPLFLWVHYLDPHFPYEPPAQFVPDGLDPTPCTSLLGHLEETVGVPAAGGWLVADRGGDSSAALSVCRQLYAAEIAFVDEQVRRLLDGLGTRRAARGEPLVVITSDHGEHLGEAGLYYEHGPSVHDAAVRVPLIVHGPGIAARVDDAPVRLEDLAPTLLELLSAEPVTDGLVADGLATDGLVADGLATNSLATNRLDGVSVAERLRPRSGVLRRLRAAPSNASGTDEPAALAESGSALFPEVVHFLHSGRADDLSCLNVRQYSLCARPDETPRLFDHRADPHFTHDLAKEEPAVYRRMLAARALWPPEQARERMLRTARWKLVDQPLAQGGHRRRLFDLEATAADGAAVDVAREHPDVVERLGARLDAWAAQLPAVGQVERSDEELEALRSLGYIG